MFAFFYLDNKRNSRSTGAIWLIVIDLVPPKRTTKDVENSGDAQMNGNTGPVLWTEILITIYGGYSKGDRYLWLFFVPTPQWGGLDRYSIRAAVIEAARA